MSFEEVMQYFVMYERILMNRPPEEALLTLEEMELTLQYEQMMYAAWLQEDMY
jgi:hypothetical protein